MGFICSCVAIIHLLGKELETGRGSNDIFRMVCLEQVYEQAHEPARDIAQKAEGPSTGHEHTRPSTQRQQPQRTPSATSLLSLSLTQNEQACQPFTVSFSSHPSLRP